MEADEKLFAELYKEHSKKIYNYIYRSIGSEDDASDILQEVFIILHDKLSELSFEDNRIIYWLYRVARNLILAHLKKAKKRNDREALTPGDWEFPSAHRDHFTRKLILKETEQQLEQFLNSLSEKERTIFTLHRVEKLKYKEIKEIMGLSERTLKRVMKRILDKINELDLLKE